MKILLGKNIQHKSEKTQPEKKKKRKKARALDRTEGQSYTSLSFSDVECLTKIQTEKKNDSTKVEEKGFCPNFLIIFSNFHRVFSDCMLECVNPKIRSVGFKNRSLLSSLSIFQIDSTFSSAAKNPRISSMSDCFADSVEVSKIPMVSAVLIKPDTRWECKAFCKRE